MFKTSAGVSRKPVPGLQVFFLDSSGAILAKGIGDDSYSQIHLIHPEAGDCHKVQAYRDLWQACFQEQAAWIPKWIKRATQVDVTFKNCKLTHIPIEVAEQNSEWLLWWIPLPHVGGIPYTYFRSTITIDEAELQEQNCGD